MLPPRAVRRKRLSMRGEWAVGERSTASRRAFSSLCAGTIERRRRHLLQSRGSAPGLFDSRALMEAREQASPGRDEVGRRSCPGSDENFYEPVAEAVEDFDGSYDAARAGGGERRQRWRSRRAFELVSGEWIGSERSGRGSHRRAMAVNAAVPAEWRWPSAFPRSGCTARRIQAVGALNQDSKLDRPPPRLYPLPSCAARGGVGVLRHPLRGVAQLGRAHGSGP